jgi:hypothetical protein
VSLVLPITEKKITRSIINGSLLTKITMREIIFLMSQSENNSQNIASVVVERDYSTTIITAVCLITPRKVQAGFQLDHGERVNEGAVVAIARP